jgi:hypothetical protein
MVTPFSLRIRLHYKAARVGDVEVVEKTSNFFPILVFRPSAFTKNSHTIKCPT